MNKLKMKVMAAAVAAETALAPVVNVFADPADEVLGPINRLASLLFKVARGLGMIFIIWALFTLLTSLRSHDPSQRTNAVIGLVAGFALLFIEPIVYYLIG